MAELDPSKLKAVIFDVDGTLYRQAPLRRAMALRLAREHLFAPLLGLRTMKMIGAYRRAQEELREQPAQSDLALLQLTTAARKSGFTAEAIAACVARWMEESPLDLLPRFVQPGLTDFVRALRAASLKLGVLSDYPAEAKLDALGLGGLFDLIFCAQSKEIGVFKPHPRGLVHALEQLGVAPEEALYIGDRAEVDAAAAAAAKIPCAILTSSSAAPAGGFLRFSRFAELQELIVSSQKSLAAPAVSTSRSRT